ncbi:hypothetical protein [Chlorogloeopsis sp. ULAP01]|uniref:hypothetical protein n=1 Tax=Chlorogloeopsis sp. ULAP01 TaxID=3056483 RepID=UPI0030153DFF
MLESMQVYARKTLSYVQATWLEVILPAARGMIAHAQGELQIAIAQLELVLPSLQQAGGSHAQRDLFEQAYLYALIRSQEYRKALGIIEKRHVKRSNIPIIQRELAYVYRELGRSVRKFNNLIT